MHTNIILLIRSLDQGGAERQLVELACGLHNKGVQVTVITFYSGGALAVELAAEGVPVISLEKEGRWDVLPFLVRLCRVIRKCKPEVLYAFQNVSCILALIARLIQPNMRVVWGVRASNMDLSQYDWLTRLSYRFECILSQFANLIIANSFAGKAYAAANGFPVEKIDVIQNGIDIVRFRPDPELGRAVRAEWNILNDEILIGIVARLDPMKDHLTFFRTAAELQKKFSRLRFVCVGEGAEPYHSRLHELAISNGLTTKLVWAGLRADMSSVYNALDFIVSSSSTEGFSNVIAEAMACGVLPVVTDVGDSRFIVGNSGFVVPPNDPEMLAGQLEWLLKLDTLEKDALKGQVRLRVLEHFTTDIMVSATLSRLEGLQ